MSRLNVQPTSDEFAFLKAHTTIKDEEHLRKHILKVQEEAYQIYPYPCIRNFMFLVPKVALSPVYEQLLKLGKDRKGAIFLDIGCAFGNDIRTTIADGYPMENVVASDLRPHFWNLGLKLFMSNPETFTVPFIPGDVFDLNFLKPVAPFYTAPDTLRPDLHALTSLTPLLGHVSAIHAGMLFHLFDEEKQTHLAHAVAGLLSPEPGSLIFGSHVGKPQKGTQMLMWPESSMLMFCHSPETWEAMWDGQVFNKGTVKVEAVLKPLDAKERARLEMEVEGDVQLYNMLWSVTRV
ncbi:hypothetical protein CERSUDRAFT_52912 [Gelatoporia subvermispora B]|uniref:Methyltransferase domain-containing protein n=1 Tax=Ceriporiopsis subvermispora (strain B) TaxID=914234 RepID=M2RAP1_CERS8|nr:hypothetical protein CERSUDRAFT_52912 [Gelatoporia subvermispora B]